MDLRRVGRYTMHPWKPRDVTTIAVTHLSPKSLANPLID